MSERLVPTPLGEGRVRVSADIVRTLSSQSSSHGSVSAGEGGNDCPDFRNSSAPALLAPSGLRVTQQGNGTLHLADAGSEPADVVFSPACPATPSASWEAPSPQRGADAAAATGRAHPHMIPHNSKTPLRGGGVGDEPVLVPEDSIVRENATANCEEEEEAEMVSLEHQRILLHQKLGSSGGVGAEPPPSFGGRSGGSSDHLRRTPGASMHRSAFLRRTPGASAMHGSASSTTKGRSTPGGSRGGADDRRRGAASAAAPVLGFGLTLSTPVGNRSADPPGKSSGGSGGIALSYSSGGSSEDRGGSMTTPAGTGSGRPVPGSATRPPRDPNSERQTYVYTPAGMSLAKNPHLSSRDAFSPNTIRLTESLDHLLHEEDDDVGIPAADRVKNRANDDNNNQVDFGKASTAVGESTDAEDWSESYTFSHDSASAKPEPVGVPRNRGKMVGVKSPLNMPRRGRKARSSPRSSPRNTGGVSAVNSSRESRPLQKSAQPVQKASAFKRLDSPDNGFGRSNGSGADEDERPGPLNFEPSGGGAFAPPTKSKAAPYQPQAGATFHTPTPKKPQRDQTGAAGPYQAPQPQPQNHGGTGYGQTYVGTHQQQSHQLPYGNEVPVGGPKAMNDPYFVPHPHQQIPDQMAAPSGMINAPSPHHFDYVTPHPYGGHPHVQMVSPVNVPAISPMTIPSYPSMELPIMQPQYHGMGSIPHMHQHGPASWSPPPMPPYATGPGAAHRSDGPIGWQQPVHGGSLNDVSGWNSYGGGSIMPPPDHPMGHMSPQPPSSPYTIPSWSDYGGAMGMNAGISASSNGSIGQQAHDLHYHNTADFQQNQHVQSHNIMESSYRDSAEFRGHNAYPDMNRSTENEYPAQQQRNHPTQASAKQNQSQGRNKGAKGIKVSKQLARKQRNDGDVANGQGATKKGTNDEPHEQPRKVERNSGNSLAPQTLQRKKAIITSPKKKKIQQPGAENAPPQDVETKGVVPVDPAGNHAHDTVPSGEIKDAAHLKRAELIESPAVRAAFKEFYREFRQKERSSFVEAEEFALRSLGNDEDKTVVEAAVLPKQVHWRVHLELADLAKRANKFDEARRVYRKVCTLQPYASQGWLEFSKLEEESGNLERCASLLSEGLSYCEYNENLLTKAIKHEERMGNLTRARQLLARLKHVGIEKVWRTVLEGALLEARAGNVGMARRVLKYLMHHVPWYGPLYLEAYRLERDADRPIEALAIVERGLSEIPRYGPLWFGAFRLCEGMDIADGALELPRTSQMLDRATKSISRELLWKVHLEAAQAQERAALMVVAKDANINLNEQLEVCRRSFAKTILTCPPSLCWKVWLAGGRMELMAGRTDEARQLFLRSHDVVPEKGRAAVMLECARLEEFAGDIELARAILSKARSNAGSDWKVWLESIFLEMRCGMRGRAIRLAQNALDVHSGTGRLWAALVQLRQPDGEAAQMSVLKRALWSVPKSGEVWCEGGRLHLNPFFPNFGLEEAELHLDFATKFTPQYGDSFLETLRLNIVLEQICPIANDMIKDLEKDFAEMPSSEKAQLWALVVDHTQCSVKKAFDSRCIPAIHCSDSSTSHVPDKGFAGALDTSELELRCSNADPNYGKLWFHCRTLPSDTARHVIRRGRSMIVSDIAATAHLYVAALVRRKGIALCLKKEITDSEYVGNSSCCGGGKDQVVVNEVNGYCNSWDKELERRLREAPSLGEMLSLPSFSGSDFVTGLMDLNRPKPLESLSLIERRQTLFGSDLVLSWKPA